MSFDLEVKNYTKVALEDAHKVVKKVVSDVMVGTVSKTSVDTGKLKNSWYASFGSQLSLQKVEIQTQKVQIALIARKE